MKVIIEGTDGFVTDIFEFHDGDDRRQAVVEAILGVVDQTSAEVIMEVTDEA